MNQKIAMRLLEEKYEHLEKVHDLYFELEPDLDYDDEACSHSSHDDEPEDLRRKGSSIKTGDLENEESPEKHQIEDDELTFRAQIDGHHHDSIHENENNHSQDNNANLEVYQNDLKMQSPEIDLKDHQKFVTADPNLNQFQQPNSLNEYLPNFDQNFQKPSLESRADEPIFYSQSTRQNDLEQQLKQQHQPNPYELMKLIESARYSPNARQKLQDTKETILSQKKVESSKMKKKPQLTANENLILSNFKEKLIEQMEVDTNKTHFSKNQKFKSGKGRYETQFFDSFRSVAKKREKEIEKGTGSGQSNPDTDILGQGPIHQTFESFRSSWSGNVEVLEIFKQNKQSLGAGFGMDGPQNQIKRKELLVDKIMKEKMLKRGLSAYDPNMVTRMDNISNKVKEEIQKVSKKHRTKSQDVDDRGRTIESQHTPREMTMQERELQQEKRRTFLNFFSSLTKGNLQGTRKAMKRKCDELHDSNKTKQAKLDSLYLELGQIAFVNLEDQLCQKSHRNSLKPVKLGGELYQGKPTDTIMDSQSTQKVFDYANLKSILEHREVLQQKLELSQKRLKESETEGDTYNQILLSLKHREIDDQKAQAKMSEKERDLSQIIEDVHQVKKLEDERKYNFKVLQAKYKKKLVQDHLKMNKILDEKQAIQTQQDIETQHILHNLLLRVREIKSLNKSLKQLDQAKSHQQAEEIKIMEVFRKRQDEFAVLKILQQLNKLRVYQQQIDQVMQRDLIQEEVLEEEGQEIERSSQIDFIRIEGLKLVDQLKGSIIDINQREKVSKMSKGSRGGSKMTGHHGSSMSANMGSKRNSNNSPYSFKVGGQESTISIMTDDPEEFNYENYVFQRVQYETMLQMDQSLLDLNAEGIIKTFQQSHITINSLRNAFKQNEHDKIEKQKILTKHQGELQFLENEAEHVQKFIQQLTQMTFKNDKENSINLNLKHQIHQYPLSPEGMTYFLDKINVKSKGIVRLNTVQANHLREFISGLKFLMSLALKKMLVMQQQGQNCIEFDEIDKAEIQQMNTKYNTKKKRKKHAQISTTDRQSPQNNSHLDFQRAHLKSRGTSFISRFSRGIDATSGMGGSRQSPNSQINSQQDSVESKRTEESTQEQQDQLMIDQDLPSLVNILLKGHQNGFKIDNQFRKRRDSCSHSQASSARSRSNAHVHLDITEFDPIYRRSDFKQVRKNVNQVLLGEYAKLVGTKQWEVLRQQGKDRVDNVYNTIIQDESQKEFLKLGTRMKKDKLKARMAEEERLKALENKKDEDDEVESRDSLDLSKPRKKDMNKERKQAADRLAQLKLLDKNENMIIKNQLYRQKHKVQEVQRSEKYFIEDLKHKISQRYQTLRNQFDSIYDSETIQRSTQNRSMTIREWDLSQASVAFGSVSKRGKANQSVAPDSVHVSPIKVANFMNSQRETLVERQSKTGTGNRPVCVKKNGKVIPNMSLQKRNLKQYHDYIRQSSEHEDFLNQKFHTLDKKLIFPPNEYSSVGPLDSFKPLRSVCFEIGANRTPATASIKQRIKISKQMTDSLRPESVSSDHPQQTSKNYRKFNKSVNDYDKFLKQTPYTAHSTFRGNSDLKNMNKYGKLPKNMRSHRLNASLDPASLNAMKKTNIQPNYMNLPNSPIYRGPHLAYEQSRYQDHLFKKYVLRKSEAIDQEQQPEASQNFNLNWMGIKPLTAAQQPRKKNRLSMKMASPTKVYNKNRSKQPVNYDLKHVRPMTQEGPTTVMHANLPHDVKQSQRQISPYQNKGLNSTNHNSKSMDSSESRTRVY